MSRVMMLGTGDLAKQLLHFITHYSPHQVVGFIDDFKQKGESVFGLKILGGQADLPALGNQFDAIALAIGYNHLETKFELIQRLKNEGYKLFTFIHPTAIVDKSSEIEDGVIVYPGVIIDQRVQILAGTLLNNGSIISHDSRIAEACFIAPGVCISGNVAVGRSCFIGAGSVINDGITIGEKIYLGSASHVISNIHETGKYVGGPRLRKI